MIVFTQEHPARLLAYYLQTQGINASYVLSADQRHAVELSDQAQWPEARQIVDDFIANPQQQKFQQAAWQVGEHLPVSASGWWSWSRLRVNMRNAPLSAIVLIVCLLTFVLANLGVVGPYLWLRILPLEQLAENHQWWRIVGPAFIHFSLLHLAFNLLWWWMLGKQIEQTFGRSCLLLLFLFTAITSNLAQLLIDGPNFGGLSGVVYGLVGCVWWLGWLRPAWGLSLPKPIIMFLLVWLVVGYADLLWIHMANTAHTVGLIAGCLFALALSLLKPASPGKDT